MIPAITIAKKRDGFELTETEISEFIRNFASGQIADYQMSAMAMAICVRGMSPTEISAMTRAMLDSGTTLPASGNRLRVDKHSTGGLGDKISLILAPLLAECGLEVPMISGRGLGLTGGTLDKLEAISGFTCDLLPDASARVLSRCGFHIVSASETIAPADRKLYALRDVTGTVESIALITSSILSKKLAANLDALVMDVKVGRGAFMKDLDSARSLARSLVATGRELGLPVTALLTDMDQPLGVAIGNANEVNESIEVLKGRGPDDVRVLTIELAAELLASTRQAANLDEARQLLSQKLDDGTAWSRFEDMIGLQGGRLEGTLPTARKHTLTAPRDGWLAGVDCQKVGEFIISCGGGRRRASDKIDPSVGLNVLLKVGDPIQQGQPLAEALCSDNAWEKWCNPLSEAFELTELAPVTTALVMERICNE